MGIEPALAKAKRSFENGNGKPWCRPSSEGWRHVPSADSIGVLAPVRPFSPGAADRHGSVFERMTSSPLFPRNVSFRSVGLCEVPKRERGLPFGQPFKDAAKAAGLRETVSFHSLQFGSGAAAPHSSRRVTPARRDQRAEDVGDSATDDGSLVAA